MIFSTIYRLYRSSLQEIIYCVLSSAAIVLESVFRGETCTVLTVLYIHDQTRGGFLKLEGEHQTLRRDSKFQFTNTVDVKFYKKN